MEVRWLGEVELTFNPSFLPFPCPSVAPGCLLWGGNHFGAGVFSPWVYPLIDP
jgi:hypothetical protein